VIALVTIKRLIALISYQTLFYRFNLLIVNSKQI